MTSVISITVAELTWTLDARECDVTLTVPDGHERFIERQPVVDSTGCRSLLLRVRRSKDAPDLDGLRRMGGNENWQLYAHADGHLVLVAPRSVPPVHVTVDAGFTSGEVSGRFDPGGPAIYPLCGLEQVLYSNWLASYGDLMLHASGVVIDGMGHAFVGDSGAGKSTAAHSLRNMHGTTVLGEDQVVLRMIGGRFWIYGTPWHLDPQMHSPLGAPLKALYFLKRDGDSGVTPMTGSEGVAQIFSTAFVPLYNHPGVDRILHRLASLAGQVPFYAFSYDLGSDLLPLIASH